MDQVCVAGHIVVGYASSQRGRVSGYFCVRGKKARVNISRYLMPGLEKGDYNDLPSVKYFLAGKSKKESGHYATTTTAHHGQMEAGFVFFDKMFLSFHIRLIN